MAKTEVEGGKKLAQKLGNIQKTVVNEIEQALVTGALMVERDYKLNVNQARLIDTGRWINSITHKEDNFGTNNPSVQVGAAVKEPPYPMLHEFGTSKFPATPTLTPAYNNNKSKILKEIAKAFKRGCGL